MSFSKFNHNITNVIFSSFMMPEELWEEDRLNVRWISLNNYDMSTMTEVIKKAILDQSTPKNILVASYQKFAGAVDVVKITERLQELVDAALSQRYNKLVLGTCFFVPSHMTVWGAVTLLNFEIQKLSDLMSMPRGNLHKYLMRTEGPRDSIRMIKPTCFVEYQLGLSLGLMLSHEGLIKYKTCALKIFDFSFAANAYRPPSQPAKPDMPPVLADTPGYMKCKFMKQVMEAKRFIPVTTPQDGDVHEPRLRCQDPKNRPPGWRHWKIYRQHGPLYSFESREGLLEGYHMRMRRSHSDITWESKSPKEEQEQEVVHLSDVSLDEEYGEDREDVDVGEDDVFVEGNKRNVEREKNSIEIELQREIDEIERLLIVEKEKSNSYRKASDNKEASLAKERACSKHWKREAEKEKERNEELLKSLKKETKVSSHVKRQNQRLCDEYYYLRGLYESKASTKYESRSSSRASMQYAKDADMEEYSDYE